MTGQDTFYYLIILPPFQLRLKTRMLLLSDTHPPSPPCRHMLSGDVPSELKLWATGTACKVTTPFPGEWGGL